MDFGTVDGPGISPQQIMKEQLNFGRELKVTQDFQVQGVLPILVLFKGQL